MYLLPRWHAKNKGQKKLRVASHIFATHTHTSTTAIGCWWMSKLLTNQQHVTGAYLGADPASAALWLLFYRSHSHIQAYINTFFITEFFITDSLKGRASQNSTFYSWPLSSSTSSSSVHHAQQRPDQVRLHVLVVLLCCVTSCITVYTVYPQELRSRRFLRLSGQLF